MELTKVQRLLEQVMTGGRVLYKVSVDGQAPQACGLLSRWDTPHIALLAQGALGVLLIWTPGLNLPSLLSYVGVASWMYYGSTGLAVLVLRRTEPELHRPFRAPVAACVAVMAGATGLVGTTLWQQPVTASGAILVCALAWPARWLWGRHLVSTNETQQQQEQGQQEGSESETESE